MAYNATMQSVVETHLFLRRAKECGVGEEERAEIVLFIATHPQAGDLIPDTGGARKLRIAKPGQGKRGGYRVITFFAHHDIPVFLLTIYAKNQKENLGQDEKSAMKILAKSLLSSYGKETK